MKKPELLAPAGNLEILKIAIEYGADAVYIGGEEYGLRANAKNFSIDQIAEGVSYAHERGKKVYVTVNILAHNDDLTGIDEYIKKLYEVHVDAIIVADPGIFTIAGEVAPNLERHISTQSSTTNWKSIEFWNKLGAPRVVPARELSIREIKEIKAKLPNIEIESFVHGAMCISYSGRCLLSNYFTKRDANRGNCAHACRWKYHLVEETRPGVYLPVVEEERGTYIFNSKDLCMIKHIDDLIEAGVDSFKVEGRMKTEYYVANVIRAYRTAIDDYFEDKEKYKANFDRYLSMIKKASYRDFTTGFFYDRPTEEDQNYETASYIRDYDYTAMVLDWNEETKTATIMQKNKFLLGDKLEMMTKDGREFEFVVSDMKDENGNAVTEAPHPEQILTIHMDEPVSKFDMIRQENHDDIIA
ncbi:MAG: U32 family peptidase [Clostridia bacterium]|nr:U32 family peptidase [Clostridia bacterium]